LRVPIYKSGEGGLQIELPLQGTMENNKEMKLDKNMVKNKKKIQQPMEHPAQKMSQSQLMFTLRRKCQNLSVKILWLD